MEIMPDARVIVRVPEGTSEQHIDRMLSARREWIEEKRQEVLIKHVESEPKKFVDGEEFFYLGSKYRLSIVTEGERTLSFDGSFRLNRTRLPDAKKLFVRWYKKEAYKNICERAEFYGRMHGIRYSGIGITSARHRWGSCNSKGSLAFSLRLVMAPQKVIDYTVIHELAHIEHRNHSPKFWAKVGEMFPGYKECLAWLRENGHKLVI